MIKTLIVEDDPMVAKINRLYLERIPDIKVLGTCKDGSNALPFIRQHRPDLVILDQYMPGLSGLELLRTIRSEKIPCDVIMITAANSRDQILEAMSLGVIDYLVKPFEFERFKEAVEKHIHRAQLLENKEELSQEELDRLLQTASTAASGPAGSKERAAGGPEKGIQNETLHILLECIRSNPDTLYNCDQLSRECSLSKVTVRRYMNYLIETDLAESIVDYRTGGRPRLLYRCKKDRL